MHRCLTLLAVSSAFLLAPLAGEGSTILDIDFESNTPGDNLEGGFGWTVLDNPGSADRGDFTVVQDTGDLFGRGTGNNVARFNAKDGSRFGVGRPVTVNSIATYSFEVVLTSASQTTNTSREMSVGFGTNPSWRADSRAVVRQSPNNSTPLNDLGIYSLLVNESGSPADYHNPVTDSTASLASGSSKAFRYDADDQTWTDVSANGSNGLSTFWVRSADGSNGSFLLDNIQTNDGVLAVLIPEPASVMLLAAVGLCLLPRRRSMV